MRLFLIRPFIFIMILSCFFIYKSTQINAETIGQTTEHMSEDQIAELRISLYKAVAQLTEVPWYFIAAGDQYERALLKPDQKSLNELIAIQIPPDKWFGALHPDKQSTHPFSIHWFDGFGKDADGDGQADLHNPLDVLYSYTLQISKHGVDIQSLRKGVWEYYKNARSVQRIGQFSDLFHHHDRIDLFQYVFPLPPKSHYTYRSTWGASRGYGGRRIHEGTDLFAHHGMPVRSTCYGVVELKGWNRFGGWRIGVRDLNNVYHYYAHLSGFEKSLQQGDLVEPGQVLGWVGSTGYGPPGTAGKFPPHLHYGLYRDVGFNEWSFDPFPYLRKWERTAK